MNPHITAGTSIRSTCVDLRKVGFGSKLPPGFEKKRTWKRSKGTCVSNSASVRLATCPNGANLEAGDENNRTPFDCVVHYLHNMINASARLATCHQHGKHPSRENSLVTRPA